jgi:hypothetical protein
MGEGRVVFFDIGDTLAGAVLDGGRLSRLEVYPFVSRRPRPDCGRGAQEFRWQLA